MCGRGRRTESIVPVADLRSLRDRPHQRLLQVGRSRESVSRLFGETALQHAVQRGRHGGLQRGRRRRWLVQAGDHHLHCGPTFERGSTGLQKESQCRLWKLILWGGATECGER